MASLPDSCDVTTEFYHERRVVASGRAKNLKCCECYEPIERGDAYYRCTGKWDGSIWSGAQHLHCWLFARSLNGRDTVGFEPGWHGEAPELRSGMGLNPWGFDRDGGCVAFEGVAEFLQQINYEGELEDLTHDPRRFWDAMRSGCKEKFAEGSGI